MLQKIVLYIFLSLICQSLAAKVNIDTLTNNKSLILEAEFEAGGILADSELKSKTFDNAHYSGFDLRVGWRVTKSKDPHYKLYNYPIYGVGFYSSSFGTNTVGKPYALYGYVQTPFGNINNKRWGFDYRIGLGLSGNFNPYNEENNPLNIALGTRNNVYLDFGIRAQYKLNNYLRAGMGISFHHFSNGALRLPNKGINLVPVGFSLTYRPDGKITKRDTSYTEPVSKDWLYHVNLGAGLKQISSDSDKRYLKTTISTYASRHLSYKWRLGAGLDLFYSDSGNSEEVAEEKSGKLSSKLSGGPSLYVVHVLTNDLVLNGNVGYYIHNQEFNGEIRKIFLRAGFRYYVYKNLNAGVSIKAHQGQADFIEWTLGYTFKR